MKEILKEIRNQLKLTQKDFAKSLGVSRGAIAQIETGSNNVSFELSHKIFEVYGVKLEDLVIRDGYLRDKNSDILYNLKYNLNVESNDITTINHSGNKKKSAEKTADDNIFKQSYFITLNGVTTLYMLVELLKSNGYIFNYLEVERLKTINSFLKSYSGIPNDNNTYAEFFKNTDANFHLAISETVNSYTKILADRLGVELTIDSLETMFSTK